MTAKARAVYHVTDIENTRTEENESQDTDKHRAHNVHVTDRKKCLARKRKKKKRRDIPGIYAGWRERVDLKAEKRKKRKCGRKRNRTMHGRGRIARTIFVRA